jgi:hypothetical protein
MISRNIDRIRIRKNGVERFVEAQNLITEFGFDSSEGEDDEDDFDVQEVLGNSINEFLLIFVTSLIICIHRIDTRIDTMYT